MPNDEYSETHFLLRAAVACGLLGGAVGLLMATIPFPQYYRLVMIAWALLGFLAPKLAAAAATFTGWILLLPLLLVPVAAIGVLAFAVGLPTAVGFLIPPSAVFVMLACVRLKMEF